MKEKELHHQSQLFLSLLQTAMQHGNMINTEALEWDSTLGLLSEISKSRSQ